MFATVLIPIWAGFCDFGGFFNLPHWVPNIQLLENQ
jgi:hypothetical protein